MPEKEGMQKDGDERGLVMENIIVVLSLRKALGAERWSHMFLLQKVVAKW